MGDILIHPRAAAPAADPVAPFSVPVLLDEDGSAWVPDAFAAGMFRYLPVCEGAALGWAPIPELRCALVLLQGGNPAAPTAEQIAFTISPAGLRGLADDLRSIADQMEGAPS